MGVEKEVRPAIVAIGYNRIHSLNRLLESVENANYDYSDVTLVISLDKSDVQKEVLRFAEDFSWSHGEKVVRTFETRQGLRQHVLQCGDLTEQYGAVIILEDDILVSPEFYHYTVEALNFYKDNATIAGIALYSHKYNGYAARQFEPLPNGYDTYMGQFGVSWGQCWTKSQWQAFREWLSGRENTPLEPCNEIPLAVPAWSKQSWEKFFIYYIVESDKYYVIPYEALATCFSDIGQHVKYVDMSSQVPLLQGRREYRFARFADAEKYDIFFENITLKEMFPKEISEDICIDLYGTRAGRHSERYLLTTKKMPYKQMATYGMFMRPRELNIRYHIEGDGITLYDTSVPQKKGKNDELAEMAYDMYSMRWQRALKYGFGGFIRAIARKLKLR